MSSFLNSALKNLGLIAKPSSSDGIRRSWSRPSVKDTDSSLKLNIESTPGDNGFNQWKDAMKMVARLPDGIPFDFRKQLWMTLANRYMETKNIDFEKVLCSCFNDKNDPDDSELGTQIVKDLHRTGCSLFSGDVAEQNQGHLKRVLLAYARWNINVGYCQGFNMLAAIILEVMDWEEKVALKVMIFLIEGVLPESYFANHLRGLSVDMAVFRDLLRMRLSSLSQHLDRLQVNARDSSTGSIYEPPLTNVFTMQWFLTLFSNCLPKDTVLKVWDLILLEGNEVLLRTALAIWDGLADRIMAVESADEFYSIMGVLTREMLEFGLMDANTLLKTICTLAPFPFPQLRELRDSYTYNIQPFTSSWSSGRRFHIFSGDDEDENEEDVVAATWCISNELHLSRKKGLTNSITPSSTFNSISPGAFGSTDSNNTPPLSFTNFNTERMTLDISALKKQYAKLRERQKQAHVIVTGAFQDQFRSRNQSSLAVNHLLIGKRPLIRKRPIQNHVTFTVKSSFAQGHGRTAVHQGTHIQSTSCNIRKHSQQNLPDIASKEMFTPNREEFKGKPSTYDIDSESSSSTSTELCDPESSEENSDSFNTELECNNESMPIGAVASECLLGQNYKHEQNLEIIDDSFKDEISNCQTDASVEVTEHVKKYGKLDKECESVKSSIILDEEFDSQNLHEKNIDMCLLKDVNYKISARTINYKLCNSQHYEKRENNVPMTLPSESCLNHQPLGETHLQNMQSNISKCSKITPMHDESWKDCGQLNESSNCYHVAEELHYCSLPNNCCVEIITSESDVPPAANPFPTHRRIGSVKHTASISSSVIDRKNQD